MLRFNFISKIGRTRRKWVVASLSTLMCFSVPIVGNAATTSTPETLKPTTEFAITPKPSPSATPSWTPSPTAVPVNVKKALLRFPRINKLVNVNKIVVINGEYCMGGKLKVICFNNRTKTYNVWDDFDAKIWFGPSK